jgi:TolB protein
VSLSPDGDLIVFSAGLFKDNLSAARRNLFKVQRDGSGITRLTTTDSTDQYPIWSPDGEFIAFSSNRDGDWEIYLFSMEDNNLRQITENESDDGKSGLTWSPDGSRIAFASDEGNRLSQDGGDDFILSEDIFVIDLETLRLENLTQDIAGCGAGNFYSFPTWAPNGETIAVALSCTGLWDLYLLNFSETPNAASIVTNAAQDNLNYGNNGIVWSSNSSLLVITSPDQNFDAVWVPSNIWEITLRDPGESIISRQITSNTNIDSIFLSVSVNN